MYTNINSLRYKISDLEWQLGQTGGDIIALSETHLGPEINDGELNYRGFKIFHKDRNVQGGGVAVYVRNNFYTTLYSLTSISEAMLLNIKSKTSNFFVLTVYRPPSNTEPLLIPSLLDEVNNKINLSVNTLFMCGDFNFPKIDWTTITSIGGYDLCNPFLSKVSELALEQHVFSPTHKLGNTLDLVFSNRAIINQLEIFDPVMSDHSVMFVSLSMTCLTLPKKKDIVTYQYSKVNLDISNLVFEEYENKIRESIRNEKSINEVYNLFWRV